MTRIIAISFIKYVDIEELNSAAELFYNDYLFFRKIDKVFSIVDDLKADGYRVILVSATLDFIAKKISDKIGISEVYSSQLSYTENKCDGHFSCDLLSRKFNYLSSLNFIAPFYIVISDNFSDVDLFVNSEKAFIVTLDKYQSKWSHIIHKMKISNFTLILV